jgi:hypothetical protein
VSRCYHELLNGSREITHARKQVDVQNDLESLLVFLVPRKLEFLVPRKLELRGANLEVGF